MGMKVGYAPVGNSGQNLDLQPDRLTDSERIYRKKAPAESAKNRPSMGTLNIECPQFPIPHHSLRITILPIWLKFSINLCAVTTSSRV